MAKTPEHKANTEYRRAVKRAGRGGSVETYRKERMARTVARWL